MRAVASGLRPLLLAGVDIAVGGVLYRQEAVVLGLLLAVAGVLVLGGVAIRMLASLRGVRAWLTAWMSTSRVSGRPVSRDTWTRL